MKQFLLILILFAIAVASVAQNNADDYLQKQAKKDSELRIFPNPCKINRVNIDYPFNEISEIRFTNITGKQVLIEKYSFPKQKLQLDLSNIPNGIYLIQIKTMDNKVVVKKLVVSKN